MPQICEDVQGGKPMKTQVTPHYGTNLARYGSLKTAHPFFCGWYVPRMRLATLKQVSLSLFKVCLKSSNINKMVSIIRLQIITLIIY